MEFWNVLRGLVGGGPGNPLAFEMQPQAQTEWCWSATAVSVNLFFNTASPWEQCQLVNVALKQSTCCDDGETDDCNQPWYLDGALQIVNNLQLWRGQRATLEEIKGAIDSGAPLCLRIEWTKGGGHFVAVYGYSGTAINIADPWEGTYSVVEYDSFPANYQDGGAWTDIFWVQP